VPKLTRRIGRLDENIMRTTILTVGTILGFGSACMALPIASLPATPKAAQAHGCHHYYAQDLSGWHRHDKTCRTLRGTVGRKGRNPTKS